MSLKTDTLTLRSRKENLLYDVSVLDKEFEKRLDLINVLDNSKQSFISCCLLFWW